MRKLIFLIIFACSAHTADSSPGNSILDYCPSWKSLAGVLLLAGTFQAQEPCPFYLSDQQIIDMTWWQEASQITACALVISNVIAPWFFFRMEERIKRTALQSHIDDITKINDKLKLNQIEYAGLQQEIHDIIWSEDQ